MRILGVKKGINPHIRVKSTFTTGYNLTYLFINGKFLQLLTSFPSIVVLPIQIVLLE